MSIMPEENKPAGKGGTANPLAKELYTKAGNLFEDNKFDEAIELYSQAINLDPDYSSAYFNRALSYAITNKYDLAERDIEQVMKKEPDSHDAPYIMGIIYESQKDYQGAKEWFNKALEKNPTYAPAKTKLAQVNEKLGISTKSEAAMAQQGAPGINVGVAKASPQTQQTGTVIEEGQIKQVDVRHFTSTFRDIVGMDKEKEFIYQNVTLAIKKPELLKSYGKKIGVGVLFYGPPGCGKTNFIRAVSGETGSGVILANINQIVDMYAGNTEKNMHAIFENARKNAPCLLFFDEVDALGTKRDSESGGGGGSGMRMAVNQFLQELDGIEKNPEGIFVVGATNQPWDMDPALKRSGRFGKSIYLRPPNLKERKGAFIYQTRNMPVGSVAFGRLARATIGFSHADIQEICDDAALRVAAEEDRTGRKRKLKTKDFLVEIRKHGNSLDEWYGMIKKDIISKTEVEVVDGKRTERVKEGKLTPEEKQRYKQFVGDVKWNSNSFVKFLKKIIRLISLYLF